MPRLRDEQLETLAWALACGEGKCEATRLAGYSWGGYAWKRCKKVEITQRVGELEPLAAAGGGPDELSHLLAAHAVEARAKGTAEGIAVAARISRQAWAERLKAVKGVAREAEPVRERLTSKGPPLFAFDVTLPLETWLTAVGAELAAD